MAAQAEALRALEAELSHARERADRLQNDELRHLSERTTLQQDHHRASQARAPPTVSAQSAADSRHSGAPRRS